MMNDERITGKDVKYAREVLGILSDLSSQTYVSIDVPTLPSTTSRMSLKSI